MSSDANVKNYTEQGGEDTHIGGRLIIDAGGSIVPASLTQPAVTALTDSTGGTPGNTLAAITSPTAVTNSSGGATGDTIIAAITQAGTAGSADITPTKDAIAKLAVLGNANAAAVVLLKNDVASLTSKVNELIAIIKAAGLAT